jgi:glycosyltransferase involved in cell wall biosynthesis
MRLSVVIPVWNDPAGLARLIPQILGLGFAAEILVADDASDPPAAPAMLAAAAGRPELASELAQDPRIRWLRSPTQRGAGHARNMGLAAARGDHVIFFDSDDLFLPAIGDLLADLGPAGAFDFCIFRHVDSRVRAAGGFGPLEADQRLWEAAGVSGPAPVPLAPRQAPVLARIAAYPWNKIYRTAFLREAGIRCTEIPVHNDVELHWMSFLRARRILAAGRIVAEHFVHPAGRRLTNRSGAERFGVFAALDALYDELERNPRAAEFAEPLAEFHTRLFGWIDGALEPELREPFAAAARTWLRRRMTRPLFALVALRNPALAGRITRLLAGAA